jgi:hypothetical protein
MRGVDYLRSMAQTHNNGVGQQEMGASLVSELHPFKHVLLDTLESQPFAGQGPSIMGANKGRPAPSFGSLLVQDPCVKQSAMGYEQSMISGLSPLIK